MSDAPHVEDMDRAVLVNPETVRDFVTAIAAHAKGALAKIEKPGFLQISRLHPTSDDIVPSRYRLDDVGHMIADAIASCEAGHNVYLEARTVRGGLRGTERGKLEDTVAVLALVIDSDADKGMGWSPPATVHPSMTVETSPGNFQFWFFLRDAVAADIGQRLGERIRKAVGCDHDTGNVVQPYRVAGTANYPNKKKIARGRITVPTLLKNFNAGALWTPELLEEAFPLPNKANGGSSAAFGGAAVGDLIQWECRGVPQFKPLKRVRFVSEDGKWVGVEGSQCCIPMNEVIVEQRETQRGAQPDESAIPADTLKIIRDGVADDKDRSLTFWNVVKVLRRSALQ